MSRTQYVLIERPEHHATAVSREVFTDMQASGELITASRPVTKAEIKRDRIHIVDDDYYYRSKAWDVFRTKYHGKTFTALVRWFNPMSGNGSVEVDGHNLVIYACNIEGRKTWFPETACVFYEAGQTVSVRIETSFGGRIDVIGLTPGTLDVEHWDAIKNQSLAFRCDDAGNAVTGLFA